MHGLQVLLVQVCVAVLRLLPAGHCLLLPVPGQWPSLARLLLLLLAYWSWYLPWAVLVVVRHEQQPLQQELQQVPDPCRVCLLCPSRQQQRWLG